MSGEGVGLFEPRDDDGAKDVVDEDDVGDVGGAEGSGDEVELDGGGGDVERVRWKGEGRALRACLGRL